MCRTIWLQAAIDGLAAAYLAAGRGGNVSPLNAAADEVERLLSRDPSLAGESRAGDERVLMVLPLVVDYELFPDQMTAVVTAVRYVPPKSQRG